MLLLGAMLLCMLPGLGYAEEPVTWALEAGVLTICGSGEMGFSRYPWADQLEEIQAIRLDEHITSIPDGAFSGCTRLSSVILSKDLRYIGSSAFRGCGSLSWITLPAGLVGIGEEAFADCPNLRSVFVPQSVSRIEDRAFDPTILLTGWKNSATEDYIKDNGGYFTQTDVHSFSDASGDWGDLSWTLQKGKMTLTGSGKIPGDTLEDYPWDAYRGDIASLVIESGITSLPESAFAQCRKLTQVTLPDTVTEIGADAFRKNCTLYAPAGSPAEAYAAENQLTFVAMGDPTQTEEARPTEETVPTQTPVPEECEPAGETVPDAAGTTGAAEEGLEQANPTEEPTPVEETVPAGDTTPTEETTAPFPPESGALTLSVGSVTAQPGQKVSIPVSISGNPGLCGLSFAISYDKTVLTLEDFDTSGELLKTGDWTVGIGAGEKALWLQSDSMDGNGEILTLVFKVAEGTPKGETAVTLLEAMAVDENAECPGLAVEPGTLTVASGTPGDVNGDGRVTQSDAKRLRRYLSGQDVAIENGNADLNADGVVNILDLALLNRLVGKE